MKIALYTNIVSPHQLPLAQAICDLIGLENYRYIYTDEFHSERAKLGWSEQANVICLKAECDESQDWLENCDVLICGHRALDLIERRCKRGLKTFYASERWFKPIEVKVGGQRSEVKQLSIKKLISPLFTFTSHVHLLIPGSLRLLHPRYFRMVRRFVTLARQYDCFRILPIGVHAYNDFLRMGIPKSKLTLWGYFVAPSVQSEKCIVNSEKCLRVLWVGRMLALKNVDTLICAVALANQTIKQSNNQTISLTLVGDGPEKPYLEKLASTVHLHLSPSPITFAPSVPISEVRTLMRSHDIYVFPSNAMDGWGAVVSEAMEEGMLVLGSNQSGAPATMLPPSHRFDCHDYKRLAALLIDAANGKLRRIPIGEWTAERATEKLLKL